MKAKMSIATTDCSAFNTMVESIGKKEKAKVSMTPSEIASYFSKTAFDASKVSWRDSSYKDIETALDAHYSGEIDLTQIWTEHVGRRIYIDPLNAGNGLIQTTGGWATFVITASNYNELSTPTDARDKAAFTVVMLCYDVNTEDREQFYGGFKTCNLYRGAPYNFDLINWLRSDEFIEDAFQTEGDGLRNLIKKVKVYTQASYEYATYSSDSKAFLLDTREIGLSVGYTSSTYVKSILDWNYQSARMNFCWTRTPYGTDSSGQYYATSSDGSIYASNMGNLNIPRFAFCI